MTKDDKHWSDPDQHVPGFSDKVNEPPETKLPETNQKPDLNDDQGVRGNTDFEYTPKDMKRPDVAPVGSVGRAPAGISEPGLGTSSTGNQVTESTPEKSQAADTDLEDQPLTVRTGDAEVDEFSERQGHKLIEEADLVAKPNAEPEPINPNEPFVETDDPEVNTYYAQKQNMIAAGEADHVGGTVPESAESQVDTEVERKEAERPTEDAVFARMMSSEYNDLDNDQGVSDDGIGGEGDEGI